MTTSRRNLLRLATVPFAAAVAAACAGETERPESAGVLGGIALDVHTDPG